MSAVAKINLTIDKGATFRHSLTLKNAKNQPIDLTGYSARMHIRAEIASTAIISALTNVNGGIVLGGKLGTVNLYISDTDTSALVELKGVYDLELVSPGLDVRRLCGGTVTMSPEVTR